MTRPIGAVGLIAATVIACASWSSSTAMAADEDPVVPVECARHEDAFEQVSALLDDGELAVADAYLAVQFADADVEPCAEFLDALVDKQRTASAQLVTSARSATAEGDEGQAATEYLQALALNAANTDARSELDVLLAPMADDAFRNARALEAAGYPDEARAAVIKALTEKSGARAADVPATLRGDRKDLLNRVGGSIPEGVREFFRPSNLPFVLAVVVGAAIVFLAILRRASSGLTPSRPSDPKRPGKARRWLATGSLRRLVRPVVQFEVQQDGATTKAGEALRDATTVALTRDGDGQQLDRAGAGEIGAALESIDFGVASVGALSKILARVLAQRVIKVSLTLEPPRAGRVGASVIVTDWRHRTFDATTMTSPIPKREDKDDDSAAYLALSPALTSFLAFTLANVWRAGKQWPPQFGKTTSEASYSAFLEGVRLHTTDPDEARANYVRSMHHDPGNWLAALHVGTFDARDPDRLDNALELLAFAAGKLSTDEDYLSRSRADYQLAITQLHIGDLLEGDARCASYSAALTTAQALCERLKQADTARSRSFADVNLATARSMCVSATIAAFAPDPDTSMPAGETDAEWLPYFQAWLIGDTEASWEAVVDDAGRSYGARYNLACAYSRASRRMDDPHAGRVRSMALRNLEAVLADRPTLRSWAQEDPAFGELRAHSQEDFERVVRAAEPDEVEAETVWHVSYITSVAP